MNENRGFRNKILKFSGIFVFYNLKESEKQIREFSFEEIPGTKIGIFIYTKRVKLIFSPGQSYLKGISNAKNYIPGIPDSYSLIQLQPKKPLFTTHQIFVFFDSKNSIFDEQAVEIVAHERRSR